MMRFGGRKTRQKPHTDADDATITLRTRDRRLEHVERAVHEHVLREPGLLGAQRDANGRLMEHEAHAVHRAIDVRLIPHVSSMSRMVGRLADAQEVPLRPW